MSDPVKTQIVNRLKEVCAPLVAEGKFRGISRTAATFMEANIKPWLFLVIGEENQVGQDNRGYLMKFVATFDCIVQDARDAYALADLSVGFLQEKVEGDLQLMNPAGTGLCSAITYMGELPYTKTVTVPIGGCLVTYEIEYRRMRAQPGTSY